MAEGDERPWVTLRDLLEVAADTEENDKVLDSLKSLAKNTLPEGWLEDRVLNLSNMDLFGAENEAETALLEKIEFAFPTVEIARAFNPAAPSLDEETFFSYKMAMLCWPFCRALITSPPALVNKIRGSAYEAQLFIHSLKPVRHLFTSRTVAARELERETTKKVQVEDEPPVKRSRLQALENRMDSMFQLLCEKIEEIPRNPIQSGRGRESEGDNTHSEDSEESESDQEPELPENKSLPDNNSGLQPLSLIPSVKESEPQIPEPSPSIKAQGIDCQKLGSKSWNKIRYVDVQKKLGASPVFSTLKVNSELASLTSKSFSQSVLAKADLAMGTLAHGLLLQREKLADALNTLVEKHSQIRKDVEGLFLGEAAVNSVSDDLLHYTCARRAEFIELRRNAFKAIEPHQTDKLASIPPSESHLFDEKQLSDFLNQQGGFQKVFAQEKKSSTQFKKPNLFRPKSRSNAQSENTPQGRSSNSKSSSYSNSRRHESKKSRGFPKRGGAKKGFSRSHRT